MFSVVDIVGSRGRCVGFVVVVCLKLMFFVVIELGCFCVWVIDEVLYSWVIFIFYFSCVFFVVVSFVGLIVGKVFD